MSDFAVFITTHGRPNNQLTLKTLLDSGYTGDYYLVLDDTDTTIDEYIQNFGKEHILVFNKLEVVNLTDTGKRIPNMKCVIYARNAVEYIAQQFELKSFVVADDDITRFRHRFIQDNSLKSVPITKSIDDILRAYSDYLLSCNISAMSFGLLSFYFAGVDALSQRAVEKLRIVHNFIFRNTSIKCDWVSDYGEDFVTSILSNQRGDIMFTPPQVQYDSKVPSKRLDGGMSELYKSTKMVNLILGSMIFQPSCISAKLFKGDYLPYIARDKAFPKIISGRYKR